MSIHFWPRSMGLIAIGFDWDGWSVDVHLVIPEWDEWVWGYEESYWNGQLRYWGIGPLVLVAAAEL